MSKVSTAMDTSSTLVSSMFSVVKSIINLLTHPWMLIGLPILIVLAAYFDPATRQAAFGLWDALGELSTALLSYAFSFATG